MVKKHNIFVINGVDTDMVHTKFGIVLDPIPPPVNITFISDLINGSSLPKTMVYVDEAKKPHKCNVSMAGRLGVPPACYWCRNIIPPKVSTIGCPIRYLPSKAVKTYYSYISKRQYSISQDITTNQHRQLSELEDDRIAIDKMDYYLTDGSFCSFNCMFAYIEDNKHDPHYNSSEILMMRMYSEIFPECKIPTINPAPHWRNLREYGGDLDIEAFRGSFNKIDYQTHGTVNCIPTGVAFEARLKF